jgi:hypothetical protein
VTALPDFAEASDLTDYRAGDPATIIAQAQGAIRRYCGWHIAPSVIETITLDGSGSRSLWLPSLHVTDIVSVTDEGTQVAADDYDWSQTGYIHRRYSCWTSRPRQIVVELIHGYDNIPPELIGVAVSLASRRASSPGGYKRETAGPFSVEFGGREFLQEELAVLDQFKLPPRP